MMNEANTLPKLQRKIWNWAAQKGILSPHNVCNQFLKLEEEWGEAMEALSKGSTEELMLEIGDCFVVLSILSKQLGESHDFVPQDYLQSPIQAALSFSAEKGWLAVDIKWMDSAKKQGTSNTFAALDIFAQSNGFTLLQCAEAAWNKIKDRKGKTVNGQFIKQSDLDGVE